MSKLLTKHSAIVNSTDVSYYVGIGASAGGLQAIEEFFSSMTSSAGLAFIVIQHLSPDYKSLMVELLSKKTTMPVMRAEDGMEVKPNHVYLIPPKKTLSIFHGKLVLKPQQLTGGINLPIDIFLRSLAEDKGDRAVGIILSGTGSDGTRGVRSIKEHNGLVMVQDEDSAKFNGMPLAAISTGVADYILSPAEMPKHLLAFVQHPHEIVRTGELKHQAEEDSLSTIFSELRSKTKVDFTFYKPSTINRRIDRRMAISQSADLDEYVQYIYNNPGEVMTLYRELLIGVTSFFRDPEAMEILFESYLPAILKRNINKEIRFWVAGCSTGEEAYTIAILVKEAMEKLGVSRDVKIFATDIDKDAIKTAGSGMYPESITSDVGPRLLSKYFYRRGEYYQIARNIREMIVFAQHNLVKDPPFTNIDLVSCRNLLIYLQPVLQQKALQMFNFSLNQEGILFLGSSETVGEMIDYFGILDQKYRIYEARGRFSERIAHIPVSHQQKEPFRKSHTPALSHFQRDEHYLSSRFLAAVTEQYVLLAVIVNEQNEVVYSVGKSDGFFKLPSGKAVFDVSQMAVRDIAIPLTTGLQKVFHNNEPISYSNIKVRFHDKTQIVTMRIVKLPGKKAQDTLAAVFFELVKEIDEQDNSALPEMYDINEQVQQRIKDLEADLQFTNENLQATIEELETSNEELQATNEELLASNEELQSTNEELQSTNEELYTVNSEYQNKINELTELTNDVDNLLTNSQIGKLLLDEDLCIRRYSEQVQEIFRIVETDINRPITHITHNIQSCDPLVEFKNVLESNKVFENEVQTQNNRHYLMRIVPYTIAPGAFSGIVITFVDITEMRDTRFQLAENLKQFNQVIENMPTGLFILQKEKSSGFRLNYLNPAAEKMTKLKLNTVRGKLLKEVVPDLARREIVAKLNNSLRSNKKAKPEEIQLVIDNRNHYFRINLYKLKKNEITLTLEDLTDDHFLRSRVDYLNQKYQYLFDSITDGVLVYDSDGKIITVNHAATYILGLSEKKLIGLKLDAPELSLVDSEGNTISWEHNPANLAFTTATPVLDYSVGILNPARNVMRWLRFNAIPQFENGAGTPSRLFVVFSDITERMEAEQKLEATIDLISQMEAGNQIAWWEYDTNSKQINTCDCRDSIFRYLPNDPPLTMEEWLNLVHPEEQEQVGLAINGLIDGKTDSFCVRYRIRSKTGSYIYVENAAQVAEQNDKTHSRSIRGLLKPIDENQAGESL